MCFDGSIASSLAESRCRGKVCVRRCGSEELDFGGHGSLEAVAVAVTVVVAVAFKGLGAVGEGLRQSPETEKKTYLDAGGVVVTIFPGRDACLIELIFKLVDPGLEEAVLLGMMFEVRP